MEKRLQSLKLPRDLTLGGTKPKKTFTPNLNVARNKHKTNDTWPKTEDKRKGNVRKDSKNNRKFGDKAERFVQSSGIFSEGVGADLLRKMRTERAYSSRDDSSSAMPVPKVKKDEWQVDNKNESKVYADIMGGDSPTEDDDHLPFAPISWNEAELKEHKVPINIKNDVKIEPGESINLHLDKLKLESDVIPKEFRETDEFSDNNPALMLWNLPDSFSGKGLSDDPNVQTLFDYKLEEMLEGEIGKMRLYKSGKIEVFIGCVKYQIEPTQLEAFSEKIVSINTKTQKPSGVVVGQIENKFTLNPDWSYLLDTGRFLYILSLTIQ